MFCQLRLELFILSFRLSVLLGWLARVGLRSFRCCDRLALFCVAEEDWLLRTCLAAHFAGAAWATVLLFENKEWTILLGASRALPVRRVWRITSAAADHSESIGSHAVEDFDSRAAGAVVLTKERHSSLQPLRIHVNTGTGQANNNTGSAASGSEVAVPGRLRDTDGTLTTSHVRQGLLVMTKGNKHNEE